MTVTWTCTDTVPVSVAETVTETVSAEGAGQSATGTCVDNAGHTVERHRDGHHIDKSAPTIDGVASPAPVNGWNNTDVTVHFACADMLSGLASCERDETLGEGANQSVTGTAADHVGHTASTPSAPSTWTRPPRALVHRWAR